MPEGQVLEFDRVTKRFGDVAAVSDFSGRVRPGVVTGFLGPNGAGKTTTLRMLLGQIRPTSGTATIGGAQYADLKHPARIIGAMHEDPGFRTRRTVERHLTAAAKAGGIALSRVDEVLRFVGLGGEAESRIGTLSLGMRQRLSAATALLGDPGAFVLDEPANGLDPEGIRWMRLLIRGLADEGRTVLVSSHVLSEVEQVADDILIIARGQQKFAGSLETLADPASGPVVVDSADRSGLETALSAEGVEYEVLRSGLTVRGSDSAAIGALAARGGVALTTLQQRGPTLEDVFLDLVNDRPVRFRSPARPAAVAAEPVAVAPAPASKPEPAPADDPEPAPADDPTPDAAAEALPDARTTPDAVSDTAAQQDPGVATSADTTAAAAASADLLASDAPVADPAPTDPVAADPVAAETGGTDAGTDSPPVSTSVADPTTEGVHAPTAEASEPAPEQEHPVEASDAPERELPGLAALAAAAASLNTPGAAADADVQTDEAAERPAEASAEHAETASFAVAATGVIDVVPGGDETSTTDEPPAWSPVPSWMPTARDAEPSPSDDVG